MNSRVCSALISFCLHLLLFYRANAVEEKFPVPKGFLGYRTISTLQKYCDCKTSYSCTCCQTVVILYTKAQRNLCVNFTYQRNGLNIDVTLNFDALRARTVTDYKPLKFCTNIPGCYFSYACVNVLELNKFPRSITVCLRLDISSKKRLWKLNYDCVSVSTELPAIPNNGTMPTANMTKEMGGMSTTMNATMTTRMPSSQMTMTTAMPSSQMTMTTAMPSSQMTMTTAMPSSQMTMTTAMPSSQMTMTTMMTTTMMATMTTTSMTTVMAETEETTTNSDVEVITVPGSEATTIMDID